MEQQSFTHGSLFSGIGGFDLAAEWMGWDNKFHCEWNPFGQSVLKHYWPNAETYTDITKTDFSLWRGRISILTGGFPCQPYSTAGKRLGKEDERHLWPHMRRAIREIQPRWVVGENVAGLISWNGGMVFDEVQAELEAEGFEVIPFVLPAAGVNAPHRRDRVWFVARNTKLYGCNASEIGGSNNGSSVTSGANQVGESSGADSVQSTFCTRPTSDAGLFRQEIGQVDAVGVEQLCEKQSFADAESFGTGEDFGRIRGWPAQNSDSNGRRGDQWEKEPGIREQRNACTRDNEQLSSDNGETRISTHAGNEGLQGRELNGTPDEGFRPCKPYQSASELHQITDWSDWPTVPPICSGNDGFSDILDADALPKDKRGKSPGNPFSKWRNESIKAGGNAIVPQVALQIFKAIKMMEDMLNEHY